MISPAPPGVRTAPPTGKRPLGRQAGFTMIELLVTIVIITLLIGLLLPAINSARKSAINARVRAEISSLETAIGAFKAKYGFEPPSQITIWTTTNDWNDHAYDKGYIRRMFPQYDFTNNPAGGSGFTSATTLNGEQCLVFFLGGMLRLYDPMDPTKGGTLVGFSKIPSRPFETSTSNREGPYFEFDTTRLNISGNAATYVPPFPSASQPYVYFSSYEGGGYTASDSSLCSPYTSAGGDFYKPNSFQIICAGADNEFGSATSFDPNNTSALDTAAGDNITNFHSGSLGGL